MSISQRNSRVVILVKALPQPSKTYGETVCCAGVTVTRDWKRLFPIRYRHLVGDSSFKRWDWVDFEFGKPKSDPRLESCHVHEESIKIGGILPKDERTALLEPMLVASTDVAVAAGKSLALVRPRNPRFYWKPKLAGEIAAEKESFRLAARQTNLFDKELSEIQPTPFDLRFKFEDDGGKHDCQNGDWEAHAMFWREAKRTNVENALKWMDSIFNDDYPKRGMVFAMGNQAKRPKTWQLLGVLRLDNPKQGELF